MSRPTPRLWPVRLTTLVLWALAAASVVVWGMRLGNPVAPAAAPVALPALAAPDAPAIARLLGAGSASNAPEVSAPAAPSSRFALIGVLAERDGGGGAALIAVDGKPAKPYRVGATVEAGMVVQSLGRRQVHLGASPEGGATLTLEMLPLR